ncbi:UDP-3-O-(3-hydroxymyristoyl)glucosamine N-acyltransferase [bacterium]|nr:MAG: UDP-3-O-(3-hydroxymyristoyl)glucosamine N-acyltransferase [bacterium]
MTTGEIAKLLQGKVLGDAALSIQSLAKIEEAGPKDLSFIANPKYVRFLDESRAGAILVGPGIARKAGTVIVVDNPYLSFVKLFEVFFPEVREVAVGVHAAAVVDETADLGEGVAIGACCVIEAGAKIGADTILYPNTHVGRDAEIGKRCIVYSNVSLRYGVRIGDRVVIQNGAVIGSDGFGFAAESNVFRKIPQVGIVVIEDDVEIGANTTIDRATLGQTRICRGTKIDNLCQIAHNVTIGEHCVIAAQTGIAGSTAIGNRCQLGGQVGIVGHLKIGDGAMFAAQTGVSNNVAAGTVVSGSPSRPIAHWKRIEASLNRLPELLKRVRELEKQLESQSATVDEKSS